MSVTVTVKGSPAEVAGLLRSLADGLPPAPAAAAAGQIAPGGMVELFQVTGGHNARSLGKFTDAAHARTFAQQKSKLALHWKQGPVQGSYGATGQKDGAFTFYSVMPVEELWLSALWSGSGTAARTSATGRRERDSPSPLSPLFLAATLTSDPPVSRRRQDRMWNAMWLPHTACATITQRKHRSRNQ